MIFWYAVLWLTQSDWTPLASLSYTDAIEIDKLVKLVELVVQLNWNIL